MTLRFACLHSVGAFTLLAMMFNHSETAKDKPYWRGLYETALRMAIGLIEQLSCIQDHVYCSAFKLVHQKVARVDNAKRRA